jgi:hypothetical protein
MMQATRGTFGRAVRRATGALAGALLGLCVAWPAQAQDVFVDPGVCVGACSPSGWFVATKQTVLRRAPDPNADQVGAVAPGQVVERITAQVRTTPSMWQVRRPHGGFLPGDEVLVYTYLGAGWFRVRHNGVVTKADLGFSLWGTDARCSNDSQCWGTLDTELRFREWFKLRTAVGVEGWVEGQVDFRPAGEREGVLGTSGRRVLSPGARPGPSATKILGTLNRRLEEIDAALLANRGLEFPADLDVSVLAGLTRDRLQSELGPHFTGCELRLDPSSGEPVYRHCRSPHAVVYAFHARPWTSPGGGTVLVLDFDHRDVCVRAAWQRTD